MSGKLSVDIHHQNSFYKLGVQAYIEQYCLNQNIAATVQPCEINERGIPVRIMTSPASYDGACAYCLLGYKNSAQEEQFISLSVLNGDNSYVRNSLVYIGTLSKFRAFSKLEELLHRCLDDAPFYPEEKKVSVCERVLLSTKERQVINYLKSGFSYKEIAILMNVTNKKVYAHKYAVMKKMRFAGKHDFMAWILSK